MQHDDVVNLEHSHNFDSGNAAAERSTRLVAWLTAVMMVVEVTAGWWYNSMALLADGFHMSSHAVAIGLSAFAYAAARRYALDHRFAFGTWKIEILGGFASAVLLLAVVGLMVYGSVERLIAPQAIHYQEAIVIASVGLLVNIVSAVLLGKAHQDDRMGHHHGEGDHHHDLNLKSAYVHVIADAATSVLAILALAGGWLYGWSWLDPATGLVGAVLVALWAKQLLTDTGKVLLDREMDHPVVREVREAVEAHTLATETGISDLHVWRVGRSSYSCALSLVTQDDALSPATVRRWLSVHQEIVHCTIEINHTVTRGSAVPSSSPS